ncbi:MULTISPECIES: galactose-1-phosphate uridylyltransferase [unclassified Streptomyces]|uniref:galactose-1-phosphate uridylyltransferase n=1 Tax=unclassified Streptomyces TaxID=2593676 RepID=UPI001F04946F|nr:MULTISPECIES: galactose-1-phosphate uridylyltransferase [unclassified Streptomyces]MCH0564293.1 galactose-1-phosphate uridylyltransferase [Streptomyces sp. MUM 2J]MCH0569464.1 galactose-1-phosphate uridylyltransferase [Streptomyces sp. MUM 136J]
MKKTSTRLADGRELIYYDLRDGVVRTAADRRPLERTVTTSEVRRDVLLGDAVAVASHRQSRTYHPPADECPLCPSEGERMSEIPDASYDVVVFENRFPSLAGDSGRCEVVCFTSDHTASFADLDEEQARLVLEAWTDRTSELSHLPSVEQVFCFENRGAEIGVTLQHPHGQIYAYPFTTPRTALMLRRLGAHKEATGGENLFDAVLERELAADRVVLEGEHWAAFVPYAAHWPYEVHLYPRRRVPDLLGLDEQARTEFPKVYLELLRRFDRIFGEGESPTPYVAAWHQAPFGALEEYDGVKRDDFALHLELFTIRRTSGKLKYLAGSESGMSVFINDVPPEHAAQRLREAASS